MKRSTDNAQFKGAWSDRIDNLFGHYHIENRRILDIGCNMGVVGYEICKHAPALYHGIDLLASHLQVARFIFKAVPVPSAFYEADLLEEPWPTHTKEYDIVYLLAVFHHLEKWSSTEKACAILRPIIEGCTETIVFRGPYSPELSEVLDSAGFKAKDHFPHPEEVLFPLTIYAR